MRKVIKGVGKMDHENWRKFVNDARSEECKGVIDGDLVEMFQVNETRKSFSCFLTRLCFL